MFFATILPGLLQDGFPYLQTVIDVGFTLEVIGGGEVVESGIKPLVIVIVNIGLDDLPGLLKSIQGVGSHTFGLEGGQAVGRMRRIRNASLFFPAGIRLRVLLRSVGETNPSFVETAIG